MKPPEADPPPPRGPRALPRRMRFEPAGGLIATQLRKASEQRGFAVARLLTHWPEVAGPDLARLCRPQRVSYARKGFGATLVLETPGAAAPLVAMRLDGLRERINAVYGYAAIARIQLVQTEGPPPGMAEGAARFDGPPRNRGADNLAAPSPARLAQARNVVAAMTEGVGDAGLKAALDRLAQNVLTRSEAALRAGRPEGKDDP